MLGDIVSINGQIGPASKAVIPVDNIEFSYGFGVYENLKVRNKFLFFPELHVKRLIESANAINLKCNSNEKVILKYVEEFVTALNEESYNIKVLLVGNQGSKGSDLYIFASSPHFLSREEKKGVKVITFEGERQIPNAKTLNMLMSYLAYSEAKKNNAYDALLVDRNGNVCEGTRTNLLYTDGKTIFTPPKELVLAGVTRKTIIEALKSEGISVVERTLNISELNKFTGYALTSTSINILPIKQINEIKIDVPEILKHAIKIYENYLEEYVKMKKQ